MVEELLFQVEEGDGARGRGEAYKENGRGRLKRRSHFLFYSFSGRESITGAESHHSQRLVSLPSSLSPVVLLLLFVVFRRRRHSCRREVITRRNADSSNRVVTAVFSKRA